MTPMQTVLLILGVLLCAAGVVALVLRARRRRRCTGTATARVAHIRYPVLKIVEYQVGGETFHHHCKISRRDAFHLKEGDEEPVFYDPASPGHAFLRAQDNLRLWLGIGGIALGVAALVSAFRPV